jgi:hypothetical protein
MVALETAGTQLHASGTCRAWLGSCDDVTRRVAGGVNGPLFTQLLQATGYVDVECVGLFRLGARSAPFRWLPGDVPGFAVHVLVCRRGARG